MKKVIFSFASETGMGASIAEETYAVVCDAISDLESELPEELDSNLSLFGQSDDELLLVLVCSSTGVGEVPQNGRKFISGLDSKGETKVKLSKCCYFILCLGDSNYANFMGGPKTLDNALSKAGAKKIFGNIYADDNDKDDFSSKTDDFIENSAEKIKQWLDGKLDYGPISDDIPLTHDQKTEKEANEKYSEILSFVSTEHLPGGQPIKVPKMPNPTYELAIKGEAKSESYSNFKKVQNGDIFDPINSPVYKCEVASAKKLTSANAAKPCWEMTFRFDEQFRIENDNGRKLRSGDCFALYTPNQDSDVEMALKRLGGDKELTAGGTRLPSWVTPNNRLSNFLRYDVELRSPVTKAMIGRLASSCTDPSIKFKLQQYISREGKDLFTALLLKQVTFIHILHAFPTLNLEISILTYLRRLQRRWYSVANYVNYSNNSEYRLIKIAFTQVQVPLAGLMTCQLSKIGNLLKSAENKHDQTAEQLSKPFGPTWDRVLISFRDPPPNMFSLPSDSAIPLLLIAAGSGLAPFIGFLEERRVHKKENDGSIELLFGCRNHDSFIYKDELDMFKYDATLKSYSVAFSREEEKHYVQDLLAKRDDLVDFINERKGLIYICGDGAGMGKGIQNVLIEKFGKEKYFQLLKEKIIREDLWR